MTTMNKMLVANSFSATHFKNDWFRAQMTSWVWFHFLVFKNTTEIKCHIFDVLKKCQNHLQHYTINSNIRRTLTYVIFENS